MKWHDWAFYVILVALTAAAAIWLWLEAGAPPEQPCGDWGPNGTIVQCP